MDPNQKTGGFLLLSEWMEGLPSIAKDARIGIGIIECES